jgi:hypothetical protein
MTDAMPDTASSHRQDINITQLPIIPIVQRQSHTNKNCLLSEGERLAIEPFKERYKSEAQQKKRVALARSEILTAYFNYLDSQNKGPKTQEELKDKTKVSIFSYGSFFTMIYKLASS